MSDSYRTDPPFATENNHLQHPDEISRPQNNFGDLEDDENDGYVPSHGTVTLGQRTVTRPGALAASGFAPENPPSLSPRRTIRLPRHISLPPPISVTLRGTQPSAGRDSDALRTNTSTSPIGLRPHEVRTRTGSSGSEGGIERPAATDRSTETTDGETTERRRVSSISRRTCRTCGEISNFMSKKHKICYDCLVHSLVQAKLFYQGFDVSRKTEEKTCIVCLDHCRYIGDKYRVCIDCLIYRLGELGVLEFEESKVLDPLYLALSSESNRDFECIDWQRKKYYDCDICESCEIEGHRRERLCIDCLFDLLIDTNHFIIRDKRTYRRM